MAPDELAEIGRALHGSRWQRALARDLDRTGIDIAPDPDGRRMRRWATGVLQVPPVVAAALRSLRAKRAQEPAIERMLATVRQEAPRASLVHAQILLRLIREGGRGAEYRDLCVDYGADPDSSTVSLAVLRLESLGLVTVDRSGKRSEGYSVKIRRAAL